MHNAAGQLDRHQWVERFTPLVRRITCRCMARLPANVQADDLAQNGMLGLLDAIKRFEVGMGAQFTTYATQRVLGAMLDGLRENDWMPRSFRRDSRRIDVAISQLEQKNGRAPSQKELACYLGKTLAEYHEMSLNALGHKLIYFEDMVSNAGEGFLERHLVDDANEPSSLLEAQGLRASLAQGIRSLSERQRHMMTLRYEQDLNLREIGEIMGVTESRVSQMHSQVVVRLRTLLLDGTGGEVKRTKRN
jgi:RNA polymerase sigma factor FliA